MERHLQLRGINSVRITTVTLVPCVCVYTRARTHVVKKHTLDKFTVVTSVDNSQPCNSWLYF